MQLRLYSIFDKQPNVSHLFHICRPSPSHHVSFSHLQSSDHQTSNNSGKAELDFASSTGGLGETARASRAARGLGSSSGSGDSAVAASLSVRAGRVHRDEGRARGAGGLVG